MLSRRRQQSQRKDQSPLDGKRTSLNSDPPQPCMGNKQQSNKGPFIHNKNIPHLALLESWIKNWIKVAKLFQKGLFLKFSH